MNNLSINKYKGSTSLNFRKQMAINAFNEIANYDSIIANYFNDKFDVKFPNKKTFTGKLVENLRYGENPHQKAAIYSNENNLNIKQLHGKKLSFNNYNDIFSALSISKSFEKNSGTVIIKHANPCGVSIEKNNLKSFNLAFNCDPMSTYGGVVSCNFKIKKELAKKLNQSYFEVIIANEFEKDALKILKKKKNVRLIDANNFQNKGNSSIYFHNDTFLYQNSDDLIINKKNLKERLNIRKSLNRYDKFKKSFYKKVQNGFLKISSKNKSKYMIINSSNKFETNQTIIFDQVKKLIK